ncbi:MAG: amidohydrolase family protein [Deltaproteobacteria bacterium]|nr:amidohydrolase family protein [Deltaproteobacteria bacterium]
MKKIINGKILTVDENFTIAQAIAIEGDRIKAVGTTEEIMNIQSPDAEIIDLGGKTVIPGLIDNHTHYFRGVQYWPFEVLLDAVSTRKEAVEKIINKGKTSNPGEWVICIGGWNVGQFRDSNEDFKREELDRLVPNNPAYLQYGFEGGYGNSQALKILGLDSPDGYVGAGTMRMGNFVGLPEAIREAQPEYDAAKWKKEYLARANRDYNRAGITALWDADAIHYENKFVDWLQEYIEENDGWTNVRHFQNIKSDAHTPEVAAEVREKVRNHPPLEKGDYFRLHSLGEMIYRPVYDINRTGWTFTPSQEDLDIYRQNLVVAAEKRWPVIDHTMTTEKADIVLDIYESVDREYDIKPLRWAFHHCDTFQRKHFERMKKFNMFGGMHVGHMTMRARKIDQPPMRTAQEVGIMWGSGTDSKIVSPYPAFFILYVLVTGKNVRGDVFLPNQTVSREEALISYTRANAWALFMEDDLGTLEPGKYADLVVLNKDYMTCPEDEIRDIESLLTLVGGRVGYEAGLLPEA